MRAFIKRAASLLLIPATKWYLKKHRKFTAHSVSVTVLPGTFHPGLFNSTQFLTDFLLQQDLNDKTLLELGCGTGFISLISAGKGANVVATDLSVKAIECVRLNTAENGLNIQVIHSDLFDNIPLQQFDWIVINPPYYAKTITTDMELAWNCGENFEYFSKLFTQLPRYINVNTRVIMVLTKGCEIGKIFSVGRDHNFSFKLLQERKTFFDEWDYLYWITRA